MGLILVIVLDFTVLLYRSLAGSSFSRIDPSCRACECFPPLPVAAGSDQLIDRVALVIVLLGTSDLLPPL